MVVALRCDACVVAICEDSPAVGTMSMFSLASVALSEFLLESLLLKWLFPLLLLLLLLLVLLLCAAPS